MYTNHCVYCSEVFCELNLWVCKLCVLFWKLPLSFLLTLRPPCSGGNGGTESAVRCPRCRSNGLIFNGYSLPVSSGIYIREYIYTYSIITLLTQVFLLQYYENCGRWSSVTVTQCQSGVQSLLMSMSMCPWARHLSPNCSIGCSFRVRVWMLRQVYSFIFLCLSELFWPRLKRCKIMHYINTYIHYGSGCCRPSKQ